MILAKGKALLKQFALYSLLSPLAPLPCIPEIRKPLATRKETLLSYDLICDVLLLLSPRCCPGTQVIRAGEDSGKMFYLRLGGLACLPTQNLINYSRPQGKENHSVLMRKFTKRSPKSLQKFITVLCFSMNDARRLETNIKHIHVPVPLIAYKNN